MEKANFKSFVKKETRKEKIEKVQTFLDKYEKDITHGIYIASIIFVILYAIFGKALTQYETSITSIKMDVKNYVNSVDTTYTMTVVFKNDNSRIEDVELDKREYANYSTEYNKGVKQFLYHKYHWFYWVCFAYLGINIIVWFSNND